jgi:hypothetical protein
MAAIVHELTIEAPAARVFDAIATQGGLRAWWTSDGWLGPCSYTWAQILARLKRYAETGRRVPYFTE